MTGDRNKSFTCGTEVVDPDDEAETEDEAEDVDSGPTTSDEDELDDHELEILPETIAEDASSANLPPVPDDHPPEPRTVTPISAVEKSPSESPETVSSPPGTRYQITHLGRTQGPAEWSKDLGLSEATIYARLAKGLPPEEVLEPLHPGRASSREEGMILSHDGVTKTVREWAALTGISPTTIIWRVQAGWPMDKVLSPPAPKSSPVARAEGVTVTDNRPRRVTSAHPRSPRIAHEGRRLTVDEWALVKHLPAETIRERLQNHWSVKDALETPAAGTETSPSPAASPPPVGGVVEVSLTLETAVMLLDLSARVPGSVRNAERLDRIRDAVLAIKKIDEELARLGKERQFLVAEFEQQTGKRC